MDNPAEDVATPEEAPVEVLKLVEAVVVPPAVEEVLVEVEDGEFVEVGFAVELVDEEEVEELEEVELVDLVVVDVEEVEEVVVGFAVVVLVDVEVEVLEVVVEVDTSMTPWPAASVTEDTVAPLLTLGS